MSSTKSQPIFSSYGYELAFLFQQGGYCLEKLYLDQNEVIFSEWSNKLNQSLGKELDEDKLDSKQLRWLWKAIVNEPNIQKYFDKERLISYSQELKLKDTRLPVLPSGEKIAIFLKNYLDEKCPTANISSISDKPDGLIILKKTLEMQPGKEDFFECCEVQAELSFKVSQPDSIEQEAKFLDLSIELISIENNTIKINVDSLNHAYKLLDRRISQERSKSKKSPGGSIYLGNLAWINEQTYISLGKIKLDVQEGEWQFPDNEERQPLGDRQIQMLLNLS